MALTGPFEQAAFEASVLSPDGRPVDFRPVLELIGAGRVGVDPADPRARLTATGSLLSARHQSAYLRSPPFEAGAGLGSEFAACWARQEVAALARRLPIEGRIRLAGPPSVRPLPAPASASATTDPMTAPHSSVPAPGRRLIEPMVAPYRDLAAGWIRPGWRADVVIVAPSLVVVGIDDGASSYLAAPLHAVSQVVDLLHRADIEALLATAAPVPVLAHHWSLDHPTRSRHLGPRLGFLDRSGRG